MEYMSAGSLYDIIKLYAEGICLSEADICYIVHEILVAIEYLHSLHRIHRDIKGKSQLGGQFPYLHQKWTTFCFLWTEQ